MNTENPLTILKSCIGKEFVSSPSPFMLWLKPIVLTAEKGRLSFQYTVRKEMTNPMKILHGGVTAAIIDDIIGATMYSLGEQYFYTTINNMIDYFSPVNEQETIIAETAIIKKGRQIVNVQCEVWNMDKTRMVAKGSSNLLKTEIRKISSL